MAVVGKRRGLFSRYGLPLALTVLLGLATLSFVSLAVLRGEPADSETEAEDTYKLTQDITDFAPAEEGETKSDVGDTPETLTAEAGSEPLPAAPGAEMEQPVQPAVAPQTKPAPETKPIGDKKPPEPEKPVATPAATDSKSKPAAPAETAAKGAGPPPPPFPAPGQETVSGETAAQDGGATGAGETRAGVTIPKPRWQTVDQNWDKVTVEEGSAATAADGEGSDFRQIGVGESVTSRPGDTTPLPPKAASPAEAETAAKTPADPGAVQTAKATPKASAKTSGRSRRTASNRSKRGASSPVAAARPGAGLELSIVNETGNPGQAEAYRDVLQAMGYKVGRIENRAASGADKTTIFYKTGREKQAQALAQRIPGQRQIAPAPPGAQQDIVIVVR